MEKGALQLVVPKIDRSVMLELAHKPGHLGRKATLAQSSEQFHWPGMNRDMKICVKVVLHVKRLVS